MIQFSSYNQRTFSIRLKAILELAVLAVVLPVLILSCGKVKEAASVAKAVKEMADVGEEMLEEGSSSIDWENYDLKEADVRKFYRGVLALQEKYPDIDFEIAMMATMETMSEGINIEKAVEKETDMTYSEYSGLSVAITLALAEAESIRFTTDVVSSIEEALNEAESLDQDMLTEEQKTALDDQRTALAEAKAEMETPEFKKRTEKANMVMGIREEMGF
ncbi:MAG: hypothetical protein PQJ58_12440 [Spirochaetales bacterium]|nr:hypothetical protein [Spirochaetales bacterium]